MMIRAMLGLSIVAIFLMSFFSQADLPQASFSLKSFEQGQIIFFGENHLLIEHKKNYQRIITEIENGEDLKKTSISIEFVQNSDQKVLNQYLTDLSATESSQEEAAYFARLHWRLSLTKNKYYDELMRGLKKAFLTSQGSLRICAINVPEIYGSFGEPLSSQKLSRLESLPLAVQNEIVKIENKPLAEIAKTNLGWDREAILAQNILVCAEGLNKTFVFIGASHGLKYPINYPFRSSNQLITLLNPQKIIVTAKFMQRFYDPLGSGLGSDERYFLSNIMFDDLVLYKATDIPSEILYRMKSGKHSKASINPDYSELFDYFIFGPEAHVMTQ